MKLLGAILLFCLAQGVIWFQLYSQFFWEWAKKHPIILAAGCGTVAAYLSIKATYLAYHAFDQAVWPGRLVGFSAGIGVFSYLTWKILGESLDAKTLVCLALAIIIVLIQLFWK